MSLPRTDEERVRAGMTLAVRRLGENVVSTACPECGTRFAMLASWDGENWLLRCTVCMARAHGQPKGSIEKSP